MDIKDKIEDIIDKVKSDKNFAANFKKDPIQAVESILGVNLPEDQVKAVIESVKAKISLDKADDVLDSIKKMF